MFSHPSKLDLIAAAHSGGYTVPEETIRDPYRRLWRLVAEAIGRCDTAAVYDSSLLKGPRIVAQISGGATIGAPSWPTWAPPLLQARWPPS